MKKYENINDVSEELNEPKKKLFKNPFAMRFNKDGKGVEKNAPKILEKPGIINYFKLLGRKLSQLFSINLIMVIGNFPVFFALLGIAYTTNNILAPDSQLYPLIQGSAFFDKSPMISTLLGVFGRQDTISVFTPATYVFLALTLLLLFTFGPVNAGTTYVLRNILRGEPVSVVSDFFYAMKKNFKQALIFGIIDILMIVMLVFDVISYRANAASSTMYLLMYFISYAMAILYFFIRMYPYLLIVTFDMKMTKIIKNSIFFSILGIKRNIMALLATIAYAIINFLILGLFLPIGIIIPFIILFGLIQYTTVYCAFPKIKQIMIDPYYKEEKNTNNNIIAAEESDDDNEEVTDS